jgi:ferrochelatase
MAIANRELFIESGGTDYRYIPCLNDRADHISTLAAISRRTLALG